MHAEVCFVGWGSTTGCFIKACSSHSSNLRLEEFKNESIFSMLYLKMYFTSQSIVSLLFKITFDLYFRFCKVDPRQVKSSQWDFCLYFKVCLVTMWSLDVICLWYYVEYSFTCQVLWPSTSFGKDCMKWSSCIFTWLFRQFDQNNTSFFITTRVVQNECNLVPQCYYQ